MNIESASLLPVTQANGTAEAVAQPLTDGSAAKEGFSDAFMAQVELLNNARAGDGSSTGNNSSLMFAQQGLAGLLPENIDEQDIASFIGNNLPPSYKISEDDDHGAALAAVTDSMRYAGIGVSSVQQAAEAGQTPANYTVQVESAEQTSDSEPGLETGLPEQGNNDGAMPLLSEEASQNIIPAITVAQEQNPPEVSEVRVTQVLSQNRAVVANDLSGDQLLTEDAPAGIGQNADIVSGLNVPVDTNAEQSNTSSQQQNTDDTSDQTESSDAQAVVAEMVVTVAGPARQAEPANSLTSIAGSGADASTEIPVAVSRDSGNAAARPPIQPVDISGNAQAGVNGLNRPTQDARDFNLNVADFNRAQVESDASNDQLPSNLEIEKNVARVGADIAQFGRNIPDNNRVDVPAISKPLSHPEWNKDLGERIVWMSNRSIPSAEIRLNPQHLGPISVRVHVSDDQTTIQFTAHHAVVRETLEASIPRLREMMSAQQLNLTDVSVSQGFSSDQGRSQSQQNFAQNFSEGGNGSSGMNDALMSSGDDVEQEIDSGRAVVSNGVLSLYA